MNFFYLYVKSFICDSLFIHLLISLFIPSFTYKFIWFSFILFSIVTFSHFFLRFCPYMKFLKLNFMVVFFFSFFLLFTLFFSIYFILGNLTYETVARKSLNFIWSRKSPISLVGSLIDVHTGTIQLEWKNLPSYSVFLTLCSSILE